MKSKSILINQINFDINFKSKKSFNSFDDYIDQKSNRDITAIIEKCLIKNGIEENFYIDKLEIDLKKFNLKNFLRKFEIEFNRVLIEYKKTNLINNLEDPNKFFLDNGYYPWWYQKNKVPENILYGSLSDNRSQKKRFLRFINQKTTKDFNNYLKKTLSKDYSIFNDFYFLINTVLSDQVYNFKKISKKSFLSKYSPFFENKFEKSKIKKLLIRVSDDFGIPFVDIVNSIYNVISYNQIEHSLSSKIFNKANIKDLILPLLKNSKNEKNNLEFLKYDEIFKNNFFYDFKSDIAKSSFFSLIEIYQAFKQKKLSRLELYQLSELTEKKEFLLHFLKDRFSPNEINIIYDFRQLINKSLSFISLDKFSVSEDKLKTNSHVFFDHILNLKHKKNLDFLINTFLKKISVYKNLSYQLLMENFMLEINYKLLSTDLYKILHAIFTREVIEVNLDSKKLEVFDYKNDKTRKFLFEFDSKLKEEKLQIKKYEKIENQFLELIFSIYNSFRIENRFKKFFKSDEDVLIFIEKQFIHFNKLTDHKTLINILNILSETIKINIDLILVKSLEIMSKKTNQTNLELDAIERIIYQIFYSKKTVSHDIYMGLINNKLLERVITVISNKSDLDINSFKKLFFSSHLIDNLNDKSFKKLTLLIDQDFRDDFILTLKKLTNFFSNENKVLFERKLRYFSIKILQEKKQKLSKNFFIFQIIKYLFPEVRTKINSKIDLSFFDNISRAIPREDSQYSKDLALESENKLDYDREIIDISNLAFKDIQNDVLKFEKNFKYLEKIINKFSISLEKIRDQNLFSEIDLPNIDDLNKNLSLFVKTIFQNKSYDRVFIDTIETVTANLSLFSKKIIKEKLFNQKSYSKFKGIIGDISLSLKKIISEKSFDHKAISKFREIVGDLNLLIKKILDDIHKEEPLEGIGDTKDLALESENKLDYDREIIDISNLAFKDIQNDVLKFEKNFKYLEKIINKFSISLEKIRDQNLFSEIDLPNIDDLNKNLSLFVKTIFQNKSYDRVFIDTIETVTANLSLFSKKIIKEKLFNQKSYSKFKGIIGDISLSLKKIISEKSFDHKAISKFREIVGDLNLLIKKILDDKSLDQKDFFDAEDVKRDLNSFLKENLNENLFNETDFNDITNINYSIDLLLKDNQKEIIFNENNFEFLLNLKNEINIPKELIYDDKYTFRNIKQIIKDEVSLLKFLEVNIYDRDLISSLVKISLSDEFKDKFNVLFERLKKFISIFEESILNINQNFNFGNLNVDGFKTILRSYLIRILTTNKINKINFSDISIGFLYHLFKSSKLNLKNLKSIENKNLSKVLTIDPKKSDPDKEEIIKQISASIKLFLEKNSFIGTTFSQKEKIYYNDLAFSIIADNKLPFWRRGENFNIRDAYKIFENAILKKRMLDLSSLLVNDKLLINLLNYAKEKSDVFKTKFIESIMDSFRLIKRKKIYNLFTELNEVKKFDSFFKKFNFKITQNQNKLSRLILPGKYEILSYYIEFGSIQTMQKNIGKKELYSNLIFLIKKDKLKIRKLIYDSSNNKSKISSILSIFPKSKKDKFFDIIDPKLNERITLFSEIIFKIYKKTFLDVLELKNTEELCIYISFLWSKSSFIIYDVDEFILDLLKKFMINYQIEKEEFFDKIKKSKIKVLKLNESLIENIYLKSILIEKNQIKNENTEVNIDPKTIKDESPVKVDSSQYININNSGLVLLWPFLYSLFEKLGYIENKKFKSEDLRQKSILLTHYLVFKNIDFKEEELILNKIMLGVEISYEIDVSKKLSDIELEMCDSLIEGVIKNWDKMANTSPQTFRETFLARNGVLNKKDSSNYSLHVEKKPYDIILTTIPWNIKRIQTLFMDNVINVEWQK